MAESGEANGAVVVERSGACVSIRGASAPGGRRVEAMLPAEPGRAAVVVDGSAAAALDALDGGLLADLYGHLPEAPGGPLRDMRLLVGGAARSGPDGSAPLAARMADALGVEVVAPDGPLVVLRRGELFSAGPAAAWWEFAPGRSAEPVGSRFPPPAWQRDLPARLGSRSPSPRVTVTPVPCGLWVRGVGGPVAELSDPGYAVPPAPERVAVLAGRPGEAHPPVGALAEVIGALPRRLRQRYVLVPYGPEPAGDAPIAQRLAEELGADVWATHGLPSYAADGSLDFPVVDGSGRSTWRPFVIESVYHPGAEPPTRWTWVPPLADLPEAGPAIFWLADGWVVEVLPSGLQVRPAAAVLEPHVLRRPADPGHVDLVVTPHPAPDAVPVAVPVAVLGAIGRLARALPPHARDRLRMLVTGRVDPSELVGLAGALGLPIRRLSRDGISPVERVEAVAADHSGARPDSVGRLHASAVPTGTSAAPPPADLTRGRPHRTEASAGDPLAAQTAAPADHVPPAPHPSGPGHPSVPLPPAAPSPAPAGAAPPPSPSPAEQPLPTPPAQGLPPPEPLSGRNPPGPPGHPPAPPQAPPVAAQSEPPSPAPERHPLCPHGLPSAPPVDPLPVAAQGAPPGWHSPGLPGHPSVPAKGHLPGGSPVQTAAPGPQPGSVPGGPAVPAHPPGAPAFAGPPVAAAMPGVRPAGAPAPVTETGSAPVPGGPAFAGPPVAAAMPGVRSAGAPAPVTEAGPVPGGAPEAFTPPAVLVPITPERASAADPWWRRGSTAQDRQQFRLSLGWRYDAASRYVTRILSERPGLRSVAARDDGLATDLAAVRVFASSEQAERMESLRTGATQPADRPFLSCVVSGLRRLPTLTGTVLRGGPDDPAAAEAYVPGRDVVELGLLLAVADPRAQLPGGVEVLIWSSTGRRLDGLVEGAEAAQVVFLPGTVFRVLDVDRTSGPQRVFLAEMPQNWRGRADAERDERIRERLRAAADARSADRPDGEGAGDAEDPAHRWSGTTLVALPGLVPAQALRGVA